jgi:hypothetical protein
MVKAAPVSRSFDNTADGHKQQSRMSIVAHSPGPVLSFVFRGEFDALNWVHPSFWRKSEFLIFIMNEYQWFWRK